MPVRGAAAGTGRLVSARFEVLFLRQRLEVPFYCPALVVEQECSERDR